VAGASLAIWIYLLFFRGGFWRMREEPSPPASGPRPSVVAVIPARNEAASVGRAVASLASQVPVVVVDDASDDGTGDIARAAGAEVVRAEPLQPGWSGKLWAVSEGLRAAAGRAPEYWLLTDADIVHEPDNVAGLAARARAGNYDLVSYMVMLECRSAAEQVLI